MAGGGCDKSRSVKGKKMHQRIAITVFLGFLIGLPGPLLADRPADFGQQWVRSNPFMMGGWLNYASTKPSMLSGAGLNSIVFNANFTSFIDNYSNAGYYPSWHANLRATSLTEDVQNTANSLYSTYPTGAAGWFIYDEPGSSSFAGMGDVATWLRAQPQFSNMLVYANLGNIYTGKSSGEAPGDAFVQSYIDAVHPDVLMYDLYPFQVGSSGMADRGFFYDSVMAHRRMALNNQLPYFAYIQSYADGAAYRYPSDSENRLNLYTYLATGYTGLSYYRYSASTSAGGALVTNYNTKGVMYDDVAAVNPEISRLGNVLKFAKSTAVGFVRGQVGSTRNSTPYSLSNWSGTTDGDPHITNVRVMQDGLLKDGLIGFFRDDRNEPLFMLTNVYAGTDTASAYALPFEITFDSSVNSLLWLDQSTGQQVVVSLNNHILDVTLAGGAGNLYKYNDGIGFMGVPEPGALVLLATSLMGLLAYAWRKRK
jgi:hypothetical protein